MTGKPKFSDVQIVSEYVADLRTIVGYYIPWIPERDDVDGYYRVINEDDTIKHALDLRSLMVAGDLIYVETKNIQLRECFRKIMGYIRRFSHSRKSLIEKASLFGISIQKKKYEKINIGCYIEIKVPTCRRCLNEMQ